MSGIKFNKRKNMAILFCVVMLVNLVIPVQAATGVPEEVLSAADSVVYIAHMVAKEEISEDKWADYAEKYPDVVLEIAGEYYMWNGSGSGFVIKDRDGEVLIATNNHVVEDNFDDIFVWLTRDKIIRAEVVFAVPEKDLSVIRIRETTGKKVVSLAEKDAQRGDAVYAVGFPSAAMGDDKAVTSDEATITDGIISAVRSHTMKNGGSPVRLLQINAAVNPGNSGGPLFDTAGNVIGINTLSSSKVLQNGTVPQGVFGAVAVSELMSLLEENGIDVSLPEETVEPTEVSIEPEEAEQKNRPGLVIFVCAFVICAVIVLLVLHRRGIVLDDISKVSENTDNSWSIPVISKESDITITGRHDAEKKTENDRSDDRYFWEIKLKD